MSPYYSYRTQISDLTLLEWSCSASVMLLRLLETGLIKHSMLQIQSQTHRIRGSDCIEGIEEWTCVRSNKYL